MRGRFFYGWVIVVVTGAVLLATAGVRSAPGAFLVSMQGDSGWTTASLSFAAAVGFIAYGLAGPISGRLMAVIGIKGVTILSLALTAAALLAAIVVTDIWLLTLTFGLLSGIATGLVASVLGATVANRWFIRGRGLIVGTFGASVSAGQLVFFPLLTTLAVGFGWRAGAIVLVAIMLVLLVPVLVLFRNDPADVGQLPRGADPDTPIEPAPPPEPAVMRRAIRSSDFWFLASTFFVCGATSNGLIGQHFIAHAVDHGFAQVAAAQALAVMGAFNFVGTIASGWLTDRYDPRKLLLMYYGFRGVSLLFLPFVHDSSGIFVFSVLFGLDYIATVPPTVALCADRFGRRNVGIVYGWVFAAHMFGAAISAWAAGIVRENVGDYAGAFVAAGWIAIVAGFAVLGIRRERPAPASEAAPA
jgi:MFS family permease